MTRQQTFHKHTKTLIFISSQENAELKPQLSITIFPSHVKN